MNNFIHFLERLTPEKMAANIEHKLAIAGNPGNMHAGQFFAMRALFLIGGIFLAFLLNRDFNNFSTFSLGFGILIILISFFYQPLGLMDKCKPSSLRSAVSCRTRWICSLFVQMLA
jgi:hypothetical protein